MSTLHPRDGASAPSPWTAAPDRDYLWIPTRLMDTLYDTPLAIGVYTLIARRWLADGGLDGVPLSDADIMRYDPQLSSRGALRRAVARLEMGGWIAAARTQGAKARYTPTWGKGRSGVRPWSKAMPSLGRGHVATQRVSRLLLDDYLGRLIPHPRVPAQVERYQVAPTLGLRDIGSYILNLRMRETAPAPALAAARLCQDATVLAVPPTRETLARAELSRHGMRHLGMLKAGPTPRPAATDGRPSIFFVGVGMIGHMIGHMIGGQAAGNAPFSPSECAKEPHTAAAETPTGMTGMLGRLNPPTPVSRAGGGGLGMSEFKPGDQPKEDTEGQQQTAEPARRANRPGRRRRVIMSTPTTDSAQRLQAFGVRPAQCVELADVPIATVEAALLDAQARPKIRDQAGWVVSLLRDVREHGWDLTLRTRGAAPDNAGPSLAALEASIARARLSGLWTVDADAPGSGAPDTPPITGDTAALLSRARASGFFGPREEPCLPAAAEAALAAEVAPAPRPAQETAAHPPLPPAADGGRPDWVTPADWQALPGVVRGVLRGARLVGDRVVAADSWRQGRMERYEPLLTRLVAAAAGDTERLDDPVLVDAPSACGPAVHRLALDACSSVRDFVITHAGVIPLPAFSGPAAGETAGVRPHSD